MKHLKTKLMASVAMLMVATVMISSASFAWFTISTAPEVKGVTTQLATNGNLEIALAAPTVSEGVASYTIPAASTTNDTGKNITWGNSVDLSPYFTVDDTDGPDKKLRPVFFDATTAAAPALSSPVFGTDGRMSDVADLTMGEAAVSASSTDAGKLVEFKDGTGDTANVWAYRTDYFLRTNTAGGIYLAATDTETDLGNGTDGSGCFLKVDNADDTTTGSEDYLDDIRVYAVVYAVSGDAEGAATLAKTATYAGTLCYGAEFEDEKLFDAAANTIYLVQTYVLWDGAELSNEEMAATDRQDVLLNIQFEHKDADGDTDLESLLPGGNEPG